MKMNKIKLINWHMFFNETITIKDNFLITGENGSGKSTLIDAIYYALSGGEDKYFNSAANIDAQRTVESYVRGKFGNEGEGKEFLRNTADIVSHIAIEFTDGSRCMVLGCVVEIVGFGKPRSKFYIIQDYAIQDVDFIDKNQVYDFNTLKSHFKLKNIDFDGKTLNEKGQKERSKIIAKDVLKLTDGERYIKLLRQAIAFRPIKEVSTFVNNFLLEDNDLDINSLMEEIRSYRETKEILDKEQKKIDFLETFVNKADKYHKNSSKLIYLNVLKIYAEIVLTEKENIEREKDIKKLNDIIESLDKKYQELDKEKTNREIERNNIDSHELLRNLRDKKDRLDRIENEIDEINKKIETFDQLLLKENDIIKNFSLKYRFKDDIRTNNYPLLKEHLRNYKDEIKTKESNNNIIIAQKNMKLDSLHIELEKKENELRNIEGGQNTYNERTTKLMEILKARLSKKYNKNISVRPLCEYLEIKDRRWEKAVEGYLNTQRFDLVIDPIYYDDAVEIYEQTKFDNNIYGVGIINIKRNEDKVEILQNSLFSKIETINKYAEYAAQMILGKVQCVDTVGELQKNKCAITDTCMVYQNRIVRNINPKIYEYPFIGQNSVLKRQEILKKDILNLQQQYKELDAEINNLKEENKIIYESKVDTLLTFDDIWNKESYLKKTYSDLKAEIIDDNKDPNIIELTDKSNKIRSILSNIYKDLSNCKEELDDAKEKRTTKKNYFQSTEDSIIDKRKEYNERKRTLDEYKIKSLIEEYSSNNTINKYQISEDCTKMTNSNNSMKNDIEKGMKEYVSRYSPTMSPLIENVEDFVNEYNKIKNRNLLELKERAERAFEGCQEGFKNDFIDKLRDRINDAKDKINAVNKNLGQNPFGTNEEIYKFTAESSDDDEMKEYYKIITSGKVMEINSLLDESLNEKYKDVLRQLFDNIIVEKNNTESEKKIKKYLDYRNYMKFDLKTIDKYDNISYFSKTNKEKSGGETQTPFYVIIAACFDRLMKKDLAFGSSTCTIILDEAFNNMDEGRISSLMEYYKNLNIQLCIVVPTTRVGTLVRYMDSTIGLIKNNNRVFVEYMFKE